MLKSGNDCAIALAEYVGNSVDNFVEMMNNKAVELGLCNTHFVTVNGLDEDEHYTTAFELAKIADYALDNKIFKNIVGTMSYNVTINGYGKNITNTNELLGYLDGVYGVKTGFTNGANRCLVTAVKRGDMDLITVVLGADTKKDRSRDSIKIIEYAFANYEMIGIKDIIYQEFDEWKVNNKVLALKGIEENIAPILDEVLINSIPVKKGMDDDIEIFIDNLSYVEAPVYKGQKVGEMRIKIEDEIRLSIDILVEHDIRKKTEKDYFKEIVKNIPKYYRYLIN